MDNPRLEFGSVPVRVAAKVYGRDPSWVKIDKESMVNENAAENV